MGKILSLILFASLVLLLSPTGPAQGQGTAPRALTNKEIIEMVRAGLSPTNITTRIQTSQCDFDTDPLTLVSLKQKGVSNDVLLAMVNAPPGASRQPTEESQGRFEVSVSVAALTPASPTHASSITRRVAKSESFRELVPLRRVYVSSSDFSAGRSVAETLSDYAGLEIVKSAKEADFVLAYSIVAIKSRVVQGSRRTRAQMIAYTLSPKGQRRRLWYENVPYKTGSAALSDQPPVTLALSFVNSLRKARGEME
ncbi:MAG TPA: hypothetical protein VM943_06930 [Pyrinomonadaceae bacterium]|nr:hypothetical protein [Pyrinomonadaceae bacterium]